MTTYYVVVVIISAAIAILGACLATIPRSKGSHAWGYYVLAIGIAGVIWGGFNVSILATEVIPEYTGPIQKITTGRLVSFDGEQLALIEDVGKSEATTFTIPKDIASQISARDILLADHSQTVIVTTDPENVIEVGLLLYGEPVISTRSVSGADIRGGTNFWWWTLAAIAAIAIAAAVLWDQVVSESYAHGIGYTVAFVSGIFLIVSAFACGAGGLAKRGDITEQYTLGSSGVVEQVGEDAGVIEQLIGLERVTFAFDSGVSTQSEDIPMHVAEKLKVDDKISYYYSSSRYSTTTTILLLFN